jgi:hypothetical protein
MDVNYARRLSTLAGLLLTMICRSGLAAEAEAIASDEPANDMVIVMASDGPGDVQLPPEAPRRSSSPIAVNYRRPAGPRHPARRRSR